MTAIQSAIDLLEAEKQGLCDRMQAIDDALGHLRRIATDLDDTAPAVPAVPAEPVRIKPRKTPAAKRSGPKADEAAQPCDECGKPVKPAGMGPHKASHRRAKEHFAAAAVEAATAATVTPILPQPAAAIAETMTRLGKALTNPRQLGHCTCGVDITDADAWAAHNKAIPGPAGHRLIRTGAAS